MKPVLLIVLTAVAACADIQSVMTEPNLEKRSERALANADAELDVARKANREQDSKAFSSALDQVRQSIELCYKSLQESGKAARKSPKYFKKAEMKLRDIAKRLDNMEKDVMMDERGPVISLKKRVEELNEQLVLDIMTKK